LVQGTALFLGEIVTFIVRDEVDYGPFAQRGRLVENDAPVLNARSEGAHVSTIRPSVASRNAEGPLPPLQKIAASALRNSRANAN
jgi:hypothetical protein